MGNDMESRLICEPSISAYDPLALSLGGYGLLDFSILDSTRV